MEESDVGKLSPDSFTKSSATSRTGDFNTHNDANLRLCSGGDEKRWHEINSNRFRVSNAGLGGSGSETRRSADVAGANSRRDRGEPPPGDSRNQSPRRRPAGRNQL